MTASTAKSPARVVAFDLDGTLSTRDTLTDFLIWRCGPLKSALLGVSLIPAAIAYLFKAIDRGRIKEIALQRFLGGMSAEALALQSKRYGQKRLPQLLRPGGLEAVRRHVAAGDRVLLVTASPEFVAGAWAAGENLEIVATRMEVVDGRITGRYIGVNCRGPEKVRRLEDFLGAPVNLAVAYGDSDGDREMLAIAQEAHFKPFHPKP